MSSVFGDILTGTDIEEGVVNTIQTWLPTYLREMERQLERDVGSLPNARSFGIMPEVSKWAEAQLPSVLIVSPGLGDSPVKDGAGHWRAEWLISVAVIVSAMDQESTRRLAMLYAAAVRAVMLQKRGATGRISDVQWADERYDEIDANETRTLYAALVSFRVWVVDVTNNEGGPISPDPAPADLPVVSLADVTLEREE